MIKTSRILIASAGVAMTFQSLANDNLPAPQATELWDPEPAIVTPGNVPSDAIVLFGGESTSEWHHGDKRPVEWVVDNDSMTVKPGSGGIASKQSFCDMQLHVEWRTPDVVPGKSGQGMGNSGIFIQGRYEVQVLNSFKNRTYANGQAGSVYKQSPPLVNASLPPMQWQTYDIIYTAPVFSEKGSVTRKGHVTVLHNGVLIQHHTEIQGPTRYRGLAQYDKKHGCAPIYLQDHGDEVSYRNIWVRPL